MLHDTSKKLIGNIKNFESNAEYLIQKLEFKEIQGEDSLLINNSVENIKSELRSLEEKINYFEVLKGLSYKSIIQDLQNFFNRAKILLTNQPSEDALQKLQEQNETEYKKELIKTVINRINALGFEPFIQYLIEDDNKQIVKALSRFLKLDYESLVQSWKNVGDWIKQLNDFYHTVAGNEQSANFALNNIKNVIDDLKEISSKIIEKDLNDYLLNSLKDTGFTIRQTGAKIGEVIIITIVTNDNQPEIRRELSIRLHVSQFGLIHNISDSFLFLRRLRINPEKNDEKLKNARMTTLKTGETISVETEDEVNFDPFAGVTFSWTYNDRNKNSIWRFLKPGFGINVSFPQFGTTTTTFVIDTTKNAISENVKKLETGIETAAGIIISLFDNAISATVGLNLKSKNKGLYFGIGFSFIQIVEKIKK